MTLAVLSPSENPNASAQETRPSVLLLNLPAYGLVHRDMGCAYTSKSNYYYPQADLFMMAASVRARALLSYLDCVIDDIHPREMLRKVESLRPDHIFTIVSSITESTDLANLREIRRILPDVKIWSTGDLIYYTDREIPEIDVQVRDFTNSDEILKHFNLSRDEHVTIRESADRRFSIGICPHELALDKRYHNPYSRYAPVAMMLTNWGCPFRCKFCAARNLQENSKYKHRDEAEVLEEIKYILSLGFKEIYFRDFTFAIPRTERLLDAIIAAGLKFKWSCATRVDVVNERVLRKMRQAGCYLIFYGIDAADDQLLVGIGKDVTTQKIFDTVALTKKIGIEVLTSFIVGFRGQNLETTKEFIFKVDPDYLAVSMLMPTYGSDLRSVTNMWDGQILDNNLNDSTFSDDKELVAFRDNLERAFYLRPRKLLNFIRLAFRGPHRIRNYALSGLGLITKWLARGDVHARVVGSRSIAQAAEK